MAKKPSEAELDRRHTRILFYVEKLSGLFGHGMWCATICFVAYFAFYAPIVETAGQTTIVSSTANWIMDFRVHFIVPVAAAALCGLGWRRERKARVKEREEKDKRIKELELQFDPSRTSSNLDPSGKPTTGGKTK